MAVFFGKPYTVRQKSGGSYDTNGKWVAGIETSITITANIQPVTGKELETMSSGRDNKGIIRAYTETALNTGVSGADGQPDIIEYSGKDWEVFQVETWDQGLLDHYKIYAALRENKV